MKGRGKIEATSHRTSTNHDTELTVVGSTMQFHVDLKQRS